MATEQSVMLVIRASRPTFRSAHDMVAFAVHAGFLAAGYVLNATGPAAFCDDALSSSSADEVGIEQWNEFDDNYAFLYTNPEGKKVLVKCLAMNDKLLVDALRDGGSEPVHLEINVGDYVGKNGGSNYSSQFKNLEKLVSSIDKEILSKLNSSSEASSSSQRLSSETRAGPRDYINQPSVGIPEPRGPQHYTSSGVHVPPVYPIGGSDILPGPGAGMYPTRGDIESGGSLLIGPNDPRFFGIGGAPGFPGGQSGVPPGARFDPYGPSGVPGFEPNRFGRNPPRPGAPHPDLEHFGSGSDFI